MFRGAAGPEHGVEVLQQDLGEQVDLVQVLQRQRAGRRPQQTDPEHTGQAGAAHPVLEAVLGHLQAEDSRGRDTS